MVRAEQQTTRPFLKRFDRDAAVGRRTLFDYLLRRRKAEERRREKHAENKARWERWKARQQRIKDAQNGPLSTRKFQYTNPETANYRRMMLNNERNISVKGALTAPVRNKRGKLTVWWAKPMTYMIVALLVGFAAVVGLNEIALVLQSMASKL